MDVTGVHPFTRAKAGITLDLGDRWVKFFPEVAYIIFALG
jgi:hypothetical protein